VLPLFAINKLTFVTLSAEKKNIYAGYCVIIVNSKFNQDGKHPSSEDLEDRKGSDQDRGKHFIYLLLH
jgi:hypothetical protein